MDGPQRFHRVPARRPRACRNDDLRRADGRVRFRRDDPLGVHARSRRWVSSGTRYEVECALDGPDFAGDGTLWAATRDDRASRGRSPHMPRVDGGILFSRTSASIRSGSSGCSTSSTMPAFRAPARGAARRFQRLRIGSERQRIRCGGDGRPRSRAARRPGVHRFSVRALSRKLTLPVGGRCASRFGTAWLGSYSAIMVDLDTLSPARRRAARGRVGRFQRTGRTVNRYSTSASAAPRGSNVRSTKCAAPSRPRVKTVEQRVP